MISHTHKCIFIHIPKCAGSSINNYLLKGEELNWKKPNYDILYGWCPKRKIHLQHATSKQLLETGLIDKKTWDEYFKFTIVRNPWDRSYSDYKWIMEDRDLKGSFKDYITASGIFKECLTDNTNKSYRGDHLLNQTDFFDSDGEFKMDFIGRFENLSDDIDQVAKELSIKDAFIQHSKKNKKRYKHYSSFYNNSKRKLVEVKYAKDIETFGYSYDERKKGLLSLKNYF